MFFTLLAQKKESYLFIGKTHKFKNSLNLMTLDFYGIPSFIVDEPSCFDLYNKKIRSDGLSITILAPEHNKMRIVEPPINGLERVRKYSVQEQFRLMGFEDGEVNFANQSYTQLSKRAANGWDVNLVGILLNHIWRQLL